MLTKNKFIAVWVLGIMSGFTLMISGNTLNFWLSKESINIKTIGIFSLVSLPYAINFIWAPVFDSIKIPKLDKLLGKRLSWILPIQIFLSFFIFLIGKFDPQDDLFAMAFLAILIALFASAQDTILGAIRTEFIEKDKQGEISGTYVFGYRLGMLLSNYLAIFVSSFISWNSIYFLFSGFVFLFPFILMLFSDALKPCEISLVEDKEAEDKAFFKQKLFYKILEPVGRVRYILLVLLFLVLYKLPDNFIGAMINPFLLHLGYNEFEISNTGKLLGITCATIGGLFASVIMKNRNIYHCLFLFGSMHALAHVMFIVQEIYGKSIYLLLLSTGLESITGGMSMTAYIAFIASLCQGRYRATQHAFFSSMMGLSRSIFPTLSGYIVVNFGWIVFYSFTIIATIPALLLVFCLKRLNQE